MGHFSSPKPLASASNDASWPANCNLPLTVLSEYRPGCFTRRPALIRGCPLQSALKSKGPTISAFKTEFSDSDTQLNVPFTAEESAVSAPNESINGNGAASDSKTKKPRSMKKPRKSRDSDQTAAMDSPLLVVTKPLPRVLILHTGALLRFCCDSIRSQHVEGILYPVTRQSHGNLFQALSVLSGGTLGMDPAASFQASGEGVNLKKGTGGVYAGMPHNLIHSCMACY